MACKCVYVTQSKLISNSMIVKEYWYIQYTMKKLSITRYSHGVFLFLSTLHAVNRLSRPQTQLPQSHWCSSRAEVWGAVFVAGSWHRPTAGCHSTQWHMFSSDHRGDEWKWLQCEAVLGVYMQIIGTVITAAILNMGTQLAKLLTSTNTSQKVTCHFYWPISYSDFISKCIHLHSIHWHPSLCSASIG